jgi:hypothetical protein
MVAVGVGSVVGVLPVTGALGGVAAPPAAEPPVPCGKDWPL